ncbi:DUF2079 domain-containing protein [Nesterenkonia flava]|uniref:DUF2079 domain-containing protein n=1 Tax=Nesterenkonia flava TaxID=469799 RepID=A0ABU1FUQ5_9MICC|nr:DUF2079 domain-containing protein [Nesterenkonia flava]MDR5712381.1 DUF2079 domain-containing protein [Nesterenkonia flava]
MKRLPLSQAASLAAVMATAGLLYLAHSLLRFRNFEALGYDLGIFDQAVRQYARFNAPYVPIKGENFHILGDHFHPIVATLAPLYWVWDDPRVLNAALIVLLVSTAVPVYLVVRGWFSHRVALLSVVALLLWWPFQAFINWDFHEIAFGVPLIGWVIWAVERRRPWLAVSLSLVLLLVREDMGATLVAIALVLMLKRHWVQALILGVCGAAGLWLAVDVIIPYFAADGEFSYWEYSALGASASAAAVFLLTQPWNALPVLVDHPLKIALLVAHFVPLWLLPLASPYVLIGLPILLSRLFNDRLTVWGLVYHYDAILAVIFLLAAFDTLRRVRTLRGGSRIANRVAVVVPAGLLVLSLVGGAVLQFTVPRHHHIFPLHFTYTGQSWAEPARTDAHRQAVELIPDGACVEAADSAAPHLVDRAYVGLAGTLDDDRVNWMIIDAHERELGGSDPLTPDEAFERAERLGFEPVLADEQGLWVMRRVDADGSTPHHAECAEYVGLER